MAVTCVVHNWLGARLGVHLHVMFHCAAPRLLSAQLVFIMDIHFPDGAGSSAGSAAQQHGRAGLRIRHETQHVNTDTCQVWGKCCFLQKPKSTCSPFSPWPGNCEHCRWREGSTPSPLSPLATAAPLGREQGPPELPVTPCCPWSPSCGKGVPPGSLGRDTAGKLYRGHPPGASSGFRGVPWLTAKLFPALLNVQQRLF